MYEKQNRRECLLALISALIVVLCTAIGVVMNLTTLHDENFDHMGLQTFCMFTVNSNILEAIAMGLVIPYAVDGLKKRYFHLPVWLVRFLLAGTVSVTLTFVVSLLVLSPVKGFVLIFTGSRFFLHGLGPICAFTAFSFFITDHHITYKECLVSLLPVFIYGGVYYTLVVLIGHENGGWNDFYGFATRVPVVIPALLLPPFTYGLACVLRYFHNRSFRRAREVRVTKEFSGDYLGGQIMKLAKRNAAADILHADIVIPRRFIKYLIATTDSDKTVRDVCHMYLDTFLDNTKY